MFDSVGAGDWVIDGRETDAETAVAAVIDWFRRRDEMRSSLVGKPAQAQALLRETFATLFRPILPH